MWHTFASVGAPESAGTRIQRGDKHEICRIGRRSFCPRYRNHMVFERLPQRVDHVAMEFWKFIGKKNSTMCERRLPGPQDRTSAADKRGIRGCMVRRAERRTDDRAAREHTRK